MSSEINEKSKEDKYDYAKKKYLDIINDKNDIDAKIHILTNLTKLEINQEAINLLKWNLFIWL